MRRQVVLIAMLVMVALTGCTAGGAPERVNGADAGGTVTAPSLEDMPYPAGTSADGLNTTKVFERHRAAIADTSYTKRTFVWVTGQLNATANVTYTVNGGAERGVMTGWRETTDRTIETNKFVANGTVYTRQQKPDSMQYDRQSITWSAFLGEAAGVPWPPRQIETIDFEPTGTAVRAGTPVVRYTGTRNATTDSATASSNISATLMLGADGIIRRLTVERMTSQGSSEGSVTFSRIGSTTVERPDWIDAAAAQTPTASTNRDDHTDSRESPTDGGETADRDGDGLIDSAERASSGPLAEADPHRHDVFVEVDYRGTADTEMIEQATAVVQERFEQAPIDNPDGSSGIDLHIIIDDRITTSDGIGLDSVSVGGQISSRYRDYRDAGYHYAVVDIGAYGGVGSYGRIVVKGNSTDAISHVFMHELGHSFGIGYDKYHGVDSLEVPAETYPSAMNYNYGGLQYNDGAPFDDWAFIENGYTPKRGGGECHSTPHWCPIAQSGS
jgi:hypothetical protein